MQYQDFLGKVQARAHLASPDQAMKATRATLETLGERLVDTHAHQLAAQLPSELGRILEDRNQESFDFDEFIARISARENVDPPDATYHARVVLETLGEAVSPSSFDTLRERLPHELRPLLAGSAGHMPKPG